ncbi:MAG TPA: L-serine ammonia-lyase, iron-sulfur-dependent, subunit alpha [Sphaerochaeta sp.]|nr:L-serine ammonia-lyase, iron-sulfur-dependent, subunit alpha [Sphaerochaeta sp.]
MDKFLELLKKEMRPAMGCTEPAASALAGAKAGSLLGTIPTSVEVITSRDMVKNAMGVGLPNCSLKGIQAAVALGVCGGSVEKGLSILSEITEEQLRLATKLPVSLSISTEVPSLYIKVTAHSGSSSAVAVISGEHDRFSFLQKDDDVLLSLPVDNCSSVLEKSDEDVISKATLSDLLAYADSAPPEAIELCLAAKDTNLIIAEHAVRNEYGLSVGRIAAESLNQEPGSLSEAFSLASALAAAASDARMAGCPLPVIINSGSGNQGITLTVPLAVVASYLKTSPERLGKALVLSELVGLSLTARKNRLSALCGAFTAAIGTACGLVYLLDGDIAIMDRAINTMIGNLTGIICDGAKMTCSLKIYSCVEAANLACKLAFRGYSPGNESGIVGKSSVESMDFLSRISREGMEETDKTILSIMLGKQT